MTARRSDLGKVASRQRSGEVGSRFRRQVRFSLLVAWLFSLPSSPARSFVFLRGLTAALRKKRERKEARRATGRKVGRRRRARFSFQARAAFGAASVVHVCQRAFPLVGFLTDARLGLLARTIVSANFRWQKLPLCFPKL